MAVRSAVVSFASPRLQTRIAAVCSAEGNLASAASTCAAWLEVGSPVLGKSLPALFGRRENSRPTATMVPTSTIHAVRRPLMNLQIAVTIPPIDLIARFFSYLIV